MEALQGSVKIIERRLETYHDLAASRRLNNEVYAGLWIICFVADCVPSFVLGQVYVAAILEECLLYVSF